MIYQDQLNPYHEENFKKNFEHSELYRRVKQDFPQIIYNRDCNNQLGGTPRQQHGDPGLLIPKFYVSAFYYLEWLLEKSPEKIYDLGCGWNIFKRYIPNIIGIGAEDPASSPSWFYADIHDYVDKDFVQGHQNFFESVFSICALHFRPLSEIRQAVLEFESMIRPGGRGWISLNLQRMLERDESFIKEKGINRVLIDQYIRSQLSNLPSKVLVFDVYVLDKPDCAMNGNIHVILEKSNQ